MNARHPLTLTAAAALTAASAAAGTWTKVTQNAPGRVELMMLLSDGTVIAANQPNSGTGSAWYRLTPDIHGSYVSGTWTTLASMHDTRLYYSSMVLRDGRVFVAGGEYGTGGAKAEIYDPVANTWTALTIPTTVLNPAATSPVTGGSQTFADSNSEILANGNVLITPVAPISWGGTVIYNPTTNVWTNGPTLLNQAYADESSWVKLPDDTVLVPDAFITKSERYNPATNLWVNDAISPVNLYDSVGGEMGAGFLLPNGKAFFLGGSGHTAYYTPTGTTAPGVWTAGPDIPANLATPDAPAAMMVTGNILCAVGPKLFSDASGLHFPSPISFYEFDYLSSTFTPVNGPTGPTDNTPPFTACMLDLPDGGVLYSHFNNDVYVYRPTGSPIAAGKPVIQSITRNADGTFHLTGTGLNGISEGAAYGDDAQMNTNFPIVRLSHSNGNTYYARTFNWSSTSVMTGSRVLTTEYKLPAGFPVGAYSVVAVANGIASDAATAAVVTGQPSSQVACAGGSAQFVCAGSGTGPISYQWRRGTTSLVNGPTVAGATTPTLTISGVGAADVGNNYNCLVTNAFSAAATVLVSLSLRPCSYGACPGDYDGSGGTADAGDVEAFFRDWLAGADCADVNCSGGTPDAADVDSFFVIWLRGGC